MLSRYLLTVVVACVASGAALAPTWGAQISASAAAEPECKALASSNFSTVEDAPTQVASSTMKPAEDNVPAYCQVKGYISPQVGFELRLPAKSWNGKFMEVGCGGWCGSIDADACDVPLQRGFACIASDMGHKGAGADVLWASNNLPAQVDYGFRATHVAALAGKAIAAKYYGKTPHPSYFVGCSTGGYQGVMEAQRFPWDFDGIIAGAPDIDEAAANLRATWIARASLDKAGKPLLAPEALRMVHEAALAQCDMDDGVKDGIISNPHSCKFDPKELVCKSGKTKDCLTSSQAEAAEKLYMGPMNSRGEQTSTGGFLPGSELGWDHFWPASAVEQFFKYGTWGYSAPPQWKYTDFDFDRDYKRFGLAPWYDNSNPDLRKFKHAGGKLIIYHGDTDTIDLPGAVTDYYETVEKTMGGRPPTQEFFRLFMIPGMNHCLDGAGAYTIDYLSYLEAWVERGKAPDVIIAAHVSDAYLASLPLATKWQEIEHTLPAPFTADVRVRLAARDLKIPLDPAIPVKFTRPIFPYPTQAVYKGTGDPNDAANFAPR